MSLRFHRMRIAIVLVAIFCVTDAWGQAAADAEKKPAPLHIRVAAYNVEYGARATPEQIGRMLKEHNFDIIGFSEVPGDDWTDRVGAVLDMKYSFVGNISSGNYKDKFKSILSRTPLRDTVEIPLPGIGWNPAGAVRAVTKLGGQDVAVYALHICHRDVEKDKDGRVPTQSQSLADHLRS
jgi:maltose 6'-phosphate phosphatase